jgi:four helix bundle protein
VSVSVVRDGDAIPVAGSRCRSMLSFQKLDVYKCSIELVAVATAIGETVPRGYSELREQLRRAAISVPLNIAEGAGRASEADGARHFAIARGSAMECAAVIDVVRVLGAINDDRYRLALELLGRVVAMLTRLYR